MIDSKAYNDLGREALVVVSIPDIGIVVRWWVYLLVVVSMVWYGMVVRRQRKLRIMIENRAGGRRMSFNAFQCLGLTMSYNVLFEMSNNVFN